MASATGNGMVVLAGSLSVDETVERIKHLLEAKGITLFVIVDHSGEAARVGLTMPPTKLVIFGSAKAGTPIMLATPGVAIDLPLKILVSKDAGGKVWISYNHPAYLQERHGFPAELEANIATMAALAEAAAG